MSNFGEIYRMLECYFFTIFFFIINFYLFFLIEQVQLYIAQGKHKSFLFLEKNGIEQTSL